MNLNDFLENEESTVSQLFLDTGYYIFPLENTNGSIVDQLRLEIFNFSKEYLSLNNISIDDFFNFTNRYVQVEQTNDLKLKLMALTSKGGSFHPAIYHSAKKYIDYIVGNEVCMQRSLNMSIQLPNDESALLPLHTDVWSGNSPYEIVFWLPLVDCYRSKSMYILPLKKSREVFENFSHYKDLNSEVLYKELESEMIFVEVPKNHAIIFSHSILHGNRVNIENETRWTYNIRFKSLMSPFGTKSLGDAFIPINIKPATRLGFTNITPSLNN